MMAYLRTLWRDERGETSILSLLLIASILALGATVGVVTLRDQLVQELGDVAVSIEQLDQSFVSAHYGTHTDTDSPTPNFSDSPNQPPEDIGFVSP